MSSNRASTTKKVQITLVEDGADELTPRAACERSHSIDSHGNLVTPMSQASTSSRYSGGDPLASGSLDDVKPHISRSFTRSVKGAARLIFQPMMSMLLSNLDESTTGQLSAELSVLQAFCKRVVGTVYFEITVCCIITADLAMITLMLDTERDDSVLDKFGFYSELLITILFTVELMMRIAAHLETGVPWTVIVETLIIVCSFVDLTLSMVRKSAGSTVMSFVRVLRGLRILRTARAIAKVFRRFPSLVLIFDALCGSFKPMCFFAIIFYIGLLTLAVVLTIQVPLAATQSDVVKKVLMNSFGSVSKSSWTLAEATICPWGVMDVAYVIFTETRSSDNFKTNLFLLILFASVWLLMLASSSVVLGVFLAQLIFLTGENKVQAVKETLRRSDALIHGLREAFAEEGFMEESNVVSWEDVVRICHRMFGEDGKENLFTLEGAKLAFNELEEVGEVRLGDFINCAFKHSSISKEIQIMAIDYQQNQVHSSLQEYGHELHEIIRSSSKYIWELASKMPELSVAVSATHRDLASLQQVEEALVAKQEALRALTQQNATASPRPDSLEEVNDQSQLNRQLEALERGHKALQQQTVRDPKYNNHNKTRATRRKTICTLQQRGL
ncbi:unnamed protein product [Polarella glacialis]|uniref:Ion transport domain-containing protein n=1 Tax=Polarella glacialis TaxID=89957 RepID=A0A813J8M6_POLGL|nr:unnamed protein product [Polarella glacialis]